MDQENPTNLLQVPLIVQKSRERRWVEIKSSISSSEPIVELKQQLKLAGPLCLVSFLQYSLEIISVMFVGRLGELSLSVASMATSFASVTGFSFMLGMGSALETLCGQAYGAEQYHMLGIHTQRAMLVLMLMAIPTSIIWTFTGTIFTWFGQDLEISTLAGSYTRWLIPSIFPYGILQCQFRFLQTQSKTKVLMISTGFTSFVHILVCWIFVCKIGLGCQGAALSCAVSYWTNVLVLSVYIKFSSDFEKTWTGFCKEGITNLGEFFVLSIPSALMVCLEYWSYEFLVFMSGLLPNPKLETSMMSVSLTTSSVIFRIPYGFGSAVSTRVSNELGAGKPRAARLAARVMMFLAVTEGVLVSLFLISVRHIWGYLFTNEEEVVSYMSNVMPVLALSNFMDGIQGVLSGTARGCGWQKIGAAVNLGAYYIIGLPCSAILTFVFHYGGMGLWMGIISGSGLQAILLLVITMRTNWEQQAINARNRVFGTSLPK
ncbi:putative multi antimicrobial extrusion protein [Helianthus annuus]|uniref:protein DETOXIFICATION 16 isoform X1 n=1 Tax=Helianthus annuus TaxID=4232 RepID=UPI000B8F5207|nr:protein DETOXIFICATION 16 isoform X1 [Helianthus annuus]KAJ0527769.1 putative multi antimicrobial extrusion protein [Helianthus annuus]